MPNTTATNFLALTLACLVLGACAGVSPAADSKALIGAKFDDYHAGNWDRWVSHYKNNARVFYNNIDRPITAREAADLHADAVVPLADYEFDEDSVSIDSFEDEDGNEWVVFYGNWVATFDKTGETVVVPTHVRYRIEDGKIVEEHGYWADSAVTEAYRRAGGEAD